MENALESLCNIEKKKISCSKITYQALVDLCKQRIFPCFKSKSCLCFLLNNILSLMLASFSFILVYGAMTILMYTANPEQPDEALNTHTNFIIVLMACVLNGTTQHVNTHIEETSLTSPYYLKSTHCHLSSIPTLYPTLLSFITLTSTLIVFAYRLCHTYSKNATLYLRYIQMYHELKGSRLVQPSQNSHTSIEISINNRTPLLAENYERHVT